MNDRSSGIIDMSDARSWKILEQISNKVDLLETKLDKVIRLEERSIVHGRELNDHERKISSQDERVRMIEIRLEKCVESTTLERKLQSVKEESERSISEIKQTVERDKTELKNLIIRGQEKAALNCKEVESKTASVSVKSSINEDRWSWLREVLKGAIVLLFSYILFSITGKK